MKTVKIDKCACRKVGAEPLNISLNNGLLHADSIKYVFRARVRIIAHHKVLVLYGYECKRILAGDRLPQWSIFQGKMDFATLERDETGKTKWRSANFYGLFEDDEVSNACFYSASDEKRVTQFGKSEWEGFEALYRLQRRIQKRRAYERRCRKDRAIAKRMEVVPSEPRMLMHWIEKNALPANLFYDYQRNNKQVKAYCTRCRHEVIIREPKNNKMMVCPRCKWPAKAKARGRRGWFEDKETCIVVQRISKTELVLRIYKAYATYHHTDVPQYWHREVARFFLQSSDGVNCKVDPYYYAFTCDPLMKWRPGERPAMPTWAYHFMNDCDGRVYLPTLKRELADTIWQYCGLDCFPMHYPKPIDVSSYLRGYLRHPKCEHLVKMGFYSLALALAGGHATAVWLDESKNKPQQLLRVKKEDLSFLKRIDVTQPALQLFQSYCANGIRDRQNLLKWQLEMDIDRDLSTEGKLMSAKKLSVYIQNQLPAYVAQSRYVRREVRRQYALNTAVTEYDDYLRMARMLHFNLKNSFVLFPKSCHAAHGEARKLKKINADQLCKEEFERIYKATNQAVAFQKYGMCIVCPKTPDEIVAEGHALHHCVGTYVERVENHECLILFVRKADKRDEPFYTIEVRNQEVKQIHGQNNIEATPEVMKFMAAWERRVLQRVIIPDIA